MSQEDQHQVENEADATTLDTERESEDITADLEELFKESEDDSEEEAPVSREEHNRIIKGLKKLATRVGRLNEAKKHEEPKEKTTVETTVTTSVNPVLKGLYFKANPEAQEVWEEVEREAKNLGKDPFELYESSNYFKGEAKSRAAARAEDEANRSKIQKPSSGSKSSSFDPTKVKEEDVMSLSKADRAKWLQAQIERERSEQDR